MRLSRVRWGRAAIVLPAICALTGLGAAGYLVDVRGDRGGQVQVPSTAEDFFQPGTQPDPSGAMLEPVVTSQTCVICHGEYLPENPDPTFEEPWDGWVASLMAQSARDPVWHAALAIANQDANLAGEYCIRCHAPGAWLAGRSSSGTTEEFIVEGFTDDFDGVNCHFCHRAVNPMLEPDSPPEDEQILADLEFPPADLRGNGRFVIDPEDVRRGPYQDIAEDPNMNIHGVPVIYSPAHRRSELCAACHDVRNPLYLKTEDGNYVPVDPENGHDFGQPHPTQNPNDMFAEQTTYSEWAASDFANGGVHFPDGRFGGNHPTGVMEECQDCHMPDQIAGGCFAWTSPPWFERRQHMGAQGRRSALSALRARHVARIRRSADRAHEGLPAGRVRHAGHPAGRSASRAGDQLHRPQAADRLPRRPADVAEREVPRRSGRDHRRARRI
jgi:mono/diheme cytochrome c family protein